MTIYSKYLSIVSTAQHYSKHYFYFSLSVCVCFANFFRITKATATSVPIFELKSCERTFSSFSPLCLSIFSWHFVSCLACRTHRDINEPLNLSDSQNKTDTFLHSYIGIKCDCVCVGGRTNASAPPAS